MASTELNEAIKGLYLDLHQPKPARIDGCPCCTDKKELCRILGARLNELNADDLRDFVMSVFYTMGDATSFRYFLPRILEIAATDETPWGVWDVEIVLHKLKLAAWQTWTAREQATVRRLLHAWFDELTRAEECDGGKIDSMICGLAQSGEPLARYFGPLVERPQALNSFFSQNANSFYAKGKLSNAFWRDHRETVSVVVEWLRSPPVQAIITQG